MRELDHNTTERIPTLEELRAMTKAERSYWLRKAAELAAPHYHNDPELTETANTIDLYEPDNTSKR